MADLKRHGRSEHEVADHQGDLFVGSGWPATLPAAGVVSQAMPQPKTLDDAALAAATAHASLSNCAALAADVVERRLLAAVPALDGLEHPRAAIVLRRLERGRAHGQS